MKKLTALLVACVMFMATASSVFAATTYETKIEANVNFRTTPSTSSPSKVIKMLKPGTKVHVIYLENDGWLYVQTTDGKKGYMSSGANYSTYNVTAAEKKASKVVNYAKSIAPKVSYKWGVRDTKNMIFDCSSYTQYVYGQAINKYIGWGANAQTNYGKKITKISDLKRGDLVMFSVATKGKIGHVGIYIGDGKFIHNLSPKYDVITSDLTSGSWKTKFISGTRVIQ
ncbi:C40 family peptidase [Gorillibacterium massiliense]|uniref:C40 family peptidase n=1 Tax=Gorillibacterium massiliense TaxID=1280390 RepID=UPI0004BC94F6|nr:SH3 domain-containing C40 family peptidase [Gorillibacterium massiliense]